MYNRKNPSPILRTLLALLIGGGLAAPATAQTGSRRDPTPEEKASILKVYNSLNPVIASFLAAHDMELDRGNSFVPETRDLSVSTAGTIGESFTWECRVTKGSERYRQHIQPAAAKIEELTQAGRYDEVKPVRQEMSRWTNLKIEVDLNSEALDLGSMPEKNTPLSVAGAARSFLRAGDDTAPENQGMRVLAFGNWKDAARDTEHHADRFHFARPPQSPFIENMVVTVSGSEDLVLEVLGKTDWAKLADSLTP